MTRSILFTGTALLILAAIPSLAGMRRGSLPEMTWVMVPTAEMCPGAYTLYTPQRGDLKSFAPAERPACLPISVELGPELRARCGDDFENSVPAERGLDLALCGEPGVLIPNVMLTSTGGVASISDSRWEPVVRNPAVCPSGEILVHGLDPNSHPVTLLPDDVLYIQLPYGLDLSSVVDSLFWQTVTEITDDVPLYGLLYQNQGAASCLVAGKDA